MKRTITMGRSWVGMLLVVIAVWLAATVAEAAFSINVRDGETGSLLTEYKWLVQEDDSNKPELGKLNSTTSASVSIHRATAKVVATGTGANPIVDLPDTGRYVITILAPGYAQSGGTFPMAGRKANQKHVDIRLNPLTKTRTAQISVLIFQDNAPVNGAPDTPAEGALPNFQLLFYDQAGEVTQDVFGNPIGTVYDTDPSGEPDVNTIKYMGQGFVLSSSRVGWVKVHDGTNWIEVQSPVPGFVGNALIQNIAPGKYGIQARPYYSPLAPAYNPADPAGFWSWSSVLQGTWIQTSTIEGTPGIDNWVVAGEPGFYTEAGFFGVHTFLGYVLPDSYCNGNAADPFCRGYTAGLNAAITPQATFPAGYVSGTYQSDVSNGFAVAGTNSISGFVVQNRINRPPLQMGLSPGIPVPTAFAALSDVNAGNRQVAVQACDPATGYFQFDGVPPGTYTLTMWDEPLDQLIDFRTITVPAGSAATATCAANTVCMGQLPLFQWFGNLKGTIYKKDANGVVGSPIANQTVALRFADGTLYQIFTPTGPDGAYSFPEVFPFFRYLLVESDNGIMKPAGATVWVDRGGPLDGTSAQQNGIWPGPPAREILLDQPGVPGNLPLLTYSTNAALDVIAGATGSYSTKTNQVFAQTLYFDETNVIDFYKQDYRPGENGGVYGNVYYATTRAQLRPFLAAQEDWEPGIPNVEVKLYRIPDSVDITTESDFVQYAVADNLVATTLTDSWDRYVNEQKKLVGCRHAMVNSGLSLNPGPPPGIPLDKYIDCAETMSFWNQIVPAVYNGTFKFTRDRFGRPLGNGNYIVKVTPPPGYLIVKEEDMNATASGEGYLPNKPQRSLKKEKVPKRMRPAKELEAPRCVGPTHVVPQFLSFDGITPVPNDSITGEVLAGSQQSLCSHKLVAVAEATNSFVQFPLFTEVPLAARMEGLVTDDLNLEFRPGNPRLGDKIGVSFMPVSIQDFNGNELVRTYTDEWGIWEAVVPAGYTVNIPTPSGVSPHMIRIVLNYPGSPDDPDPWYNPGYPTQTGWQFDLWPGRITYTDTPIIPIRPNTLGGLDCTLPDGEPVIKTVMVQGNNGAGPWVKDGLTAPALVAITSLGATSVRNLDPAKPAEIDKDFGFGQVQGRVLLDGVEHPNVSVVSWSASTVVISIDPALTAAPKRFQLTVQRGDNYRLTTSGINLHVGVPAAKVRQVGTGYQTIQEAVDAAESGDIVLVPPGLYAENVIMYKPIVLQGYGSAAMSPADATVSSITAAYMNPEKLTVWNAKLNDVLIEAATPGAVVGGATLITTKYDFTPYHSGGGQPDFTESSGAGVLVLAPFADASVYGKVAKAFGSTDYDNQAVIDGLAISGSMLGGGVFVDSYANNLRISNNKIFANQGLYGGGIRVGTPAVTTLAADQSCAPGVTFSARSGYAGACNTKLQLLNNQVISNGANGISLASGAGIGLFAGSDDYTVKNNWICGNYSFLAGSGLAHQGYSAGANTIESNRILFNESFDEGGGIYIAGEFPAVAANPASVSPGAGNVVIRNNLVQGNKAGNLGGGIGIDRLNGSDVAANPGNSAAWHAAQVTNNLVVNNLSGGYGAGVALGDVMNIDLINNTIANNDATGTGELAFGNLTGWQEGIIPITPNMVTTILPSGLASRLYSAPLWNNAAAAQASHGVPDGVLGYPNAAAVRMQNDLIYNNRAWYWNGSAIVQRSEAKLKTWDVGVYGATNGGLLKTTSSLLTRADGLNQDPAGTGNLYASSAGVPAFLSEYQNTLSGSQGGAALGFFVNYTYSPQYLTGDYHLVTGSPAIGAGTVGAAVPAIDYDFDVRPFPPSIGADDVYKPATPIGVTPGAMKGDVNGDATINVVDVYYALKLAAGLLTASDPIYNTAQKQTDVLYRVRVAPPEFTQTGAVRPNTGSAVYTPNTTSTDLLKDALLILQRSVGMVQW